jgi:2-octaprenyl-6-methoxyphenol hydroxylase
MTEEYDARATALSFATRQVLRAAGAWDKIAPYAEPLRDIRVADGESPLFLHFDADDNAGGAPFGWNVENTILRHALYENLRGMKNARHLAPTEIKSFFRDDTLAGVVLKDGARIAAPLLIGADGRGSAVRKWLDIPVKTADYGQTAIACTIAHEFDHENVATEHFLPDGPFAVLPLTKGRDGAFRSSVIWSVHGGDAQKIIAEDFNAALQERCGQHLGRVTCLTQPRGYPLSLMHAERYTAPRTALVAEAAHVVHPIAGQGLNLGMRDVAVLAESIVDSLRLGLDPGRAAALEEYESLRQGDTRLMIGFTDILNRLFSNEWRSLATTRRLGLGIVEKFPAAKGFFARQAMALSTRPSRILREGRV